MRNYEIEKDPHSGVFYIELTEDTLLYFAPQSAQDLSGWSINQGGCLLGFCEDWEQAPHSKIVEDLKKMRKALEKFVGQNDAKEITAEVIVKIMQEE